MKIPRLFSRSWRDTEKKQHSNINDDTGFPSTLTPDESDAALADRVSELETFANEASMAIEGTVSVADAADARSKLIGNALLEGGRVIGNFNGLSLTNFTADTPKYFNLGGATAAIGERSIFPKSAPAQTISALFETARSENNPSGVVGKFIENPVEDQANYWRMRFNYSGKASTKALNLTIHLYNPTSGWRATETHALSLTKTAGSFTILLISVSDDESIVSPNGLIIGAELSSTDNSVVLELVQVSRLNSTPLIYGQAVN